MKKLIALSSVAILACLCLAAEGHKPKHEVVVLQTCYAIGPAYTFGGLLVVNASWSEGVAPIPRQNWSDPDQTNLVQYAEKLAELLDQGFEIKNIQPPGPWEMGQTVTLVR